MKKKAFSEFIRQVSGGVTPIMPIKDIASATRVHEQTVYSWKNDHTEPGYSKIMDFNDELMRREYFHLAMQFMPNSGKGKANGSLDDDTATMIQLIGRLYDAQTKAEYDNSMVQIKQVVKNFQAEGEGMF